MSSNLPPGVSVNDIPGNRPEDIAEDAFWEKFDKQLEEAQILTPEEYDEMHEHFWFIRVIQIARDIGYEVGYSDHRYDEDLERMENEG